MSRDREAAENRIPKDKFIDLGEIYLRGLIETDLAGNWYKWFNDPEVNRFQNKGIFPNSPGKQREYYERLIQSRDEIVLAIIHSESDLHIGNIGLHKIDYIHRHAEVGIVLGEKEYWNKGFATKSLVAIRNYAFNSLNLHRLTAYIMKGNLSSFRAFSKAGFKEEGVLSECFYKNGHYLDSVIVGCIKGKQK